MSYAKDVEKVPEASYETRSDDVLPGESLNYGTGFFGKMQKLAGKYGVEQRGIERVPENERTDNKHPLLNVATMWMSCNMVVSSFALGVLGRSIFQLGFVDAILVILFFNLLGIAPVCWYSSFGPKFGLRQMVLSRYWFGWWGVKLVAVFNAIACIGWSAVNAIVGASLIHAVNTDVPAWAGVLIVSLCTLVICFFGYKVVHAYEFYSWIPNFIIFLIILGVFARSGDFVNLPMGVGTSEMGSVLSFGAVIFGFATGWASYSADYSVYIILEELTEIIKPATMSRTKVFFATWLGLIVPLLFTEMLGAAVMTATALNDGDNIYAQGYEKTKIGGLLSAVLVPPLGNFGQFCLVMLSLTIISNNVPNVYSVALTLQVVSRWTAKVPRFVWTTIATAVYIAIAIAGYAHFESVLHNFMNFIGYWLGKQAYIFLHTIYEGVSIVDHFCFKRSFSGYNLELWDNAKALPPGFAAIGAFCVGIAGVVVGMSQSYYVGPLALKAGALPYGGDVAFEMGFIMAAVSYLGLRHLELRYFHR